MPTYHTTGIVIGRTNFGEADRIVRLLTPDYGKLSAVARGVRKIKSRAGGHLELFGEVKLMLATGRNLDVITSAQLSWYPHNLATAYDRLGLAFAMGAAVDHLIQPGHPQPKVFAMLGEGLRALEGGAGGPLPELWFKLRLLELMGYRPELNICAVGGERDPAISYYFDAERGGIVCAGDATTRTNPMSPSTIKFWRLLCDYPYTTVSQIADGPALASASLRLCNEFYDYHLGRSFSPTIGA